jgi:hypothetical protein
VEDVKNHAACENKKAGGFFRLLIGNKMFLSKITIFPALYNEIAV